MTTAAIILAAGASRRFGSPKQVAALGDRTMLEVVIDAAHGAGLAPILVVAPTAVPIPELVERVPNDRPADGLSASLRLGIAAVPADVDEVVILLGDAPTVSAASIRDLVAADREGRPIVATQADGRISPPVLIERRAFDVGLQAEGDAGLRDVLGRRPDLVTPLAVPESHVDVDTPEDLAGSIEVCPGCRAVVRAQPRAETHAYIGASPACWAKFGELIGREFSDPAFGAVHRHTVDVYAAQHPGVDGRRQRQSVAVHLISICAWLEHGMDADALLPMTKRLTDHKREWPWLESPVAYELSVLDALRARSGAEHGELVRAWGADVWRAWGPHQAQVREWTADARRS